MKEPDEVRDRPAELWIKVIGLVAMVTLPLIGLIGTLVLRTLDDMSANISAMRKDLSSVTTSVDVNSNHIKFNRELINENRANIKKHWDEISKLKERK